MESIDPATATGLPGLTFLFVRILLCGPDAHHLFPSGCSMAGRCVSLYAKRTQKVTGLRSIRGILAHYICRSECGGNGAKICI